MHPAVSNPSGPAAYPAPLVLAVLVDLFSALRAK